MMSVGVTPNHRSAAPPRRSAVAPSAVVPSRIALPQFVVVSIHLLIFGSLFSGLPGPAALGELSGEGAIYGAAALILWAVLSGAVFDTRGISSALIFLPFVACIFISYGVNADDISNAHFVGRAGTEKYVTSSLVVVLYILIFFAIACVVSVYGVRSTLLCASDAAVWCGFLLVAEMALEIVSWFIPPLREAWRIARWTWVSHEFYSEPIERLAVSSDRLFGFASEPSLNAIAIMGLLGLLGSEVVLRSGTADWSRSRSRAVLFLIVALFAAELLLANARTFFVGLLGAVLAGILLSRLANWLPAWLRTAVIVLGPLPVQGAMIWKILQADPNSLSASNITRSVGMIAASKIWYQHPVFGVGLGQYGFHFREFVPSWGTRGSVEVSRYFQFDQYDLVTGLPPSFSMLSRVGAELGILGTISWVFATFFAIRRAIRQCPGALTSVMVLALSAQIWVGLSFDSFRNIYYWFWIAILMAWPAQCERNNYKMSA